MRYSEGLQSTIDQARSHGIGDLLRRSAARHPHKLALVCGDSRETFAELDCAVNRLANALAARGIAPGERVALLSRNCRGFVLAYLALARIGAISVPVNFMLNAAEVAYILGHAGAIGMIVEENLPGVANEAIAAAGCTLRLRGVIGAGPGWEPVSTWTQH